MGRPRASSPVKRGTTPKRGQEMQELDKAATGSQPRLGRVPDGVRWHKKGNGE
jgi:hypothetical protein